MDLRRSNFVFSYCCLILVNVSFLSAQEIPSNIFNLSTVQDSLSGGELVIHGDSVPWSNSWYFSAGFGNPEGLRLDVGYNFGKLLGFGMTINRYDKWSSQSDNSKVGITGRVFIPYFSPATPFYILLGYGQSGFIFGAGDHYVHVILGSMISIRPWLQLRPELGWTTTSKYLSGGLFGPETFEDKQHFLLNIAFEIDFRDIDLR